MLTAEENAPASMPYPDGAPQDPVLSVIVPASNEEGWIARCMVAVLASDPVPGGAELIVVANGCRDRTPEVALSVPVPPGWRVKVLDLAQGSKPAALTEGDEVARGTIRAYLDADCVVSPQVMAELVAVLSVDAPRYAGATPVIPRPKSWVSRNYARFWQQLPFNQTVAPGYGLYAVNRKGHYRWGAFPKLISDDSFVRLQFLPEERVQVPARYDWPMVEGFAPLVRVRRRQDAGVKELEQRHPGILAREGKPPLGKGQLMRLALADPLGFLTYAVVTLWVKLGRSHKRGGGGFTRGR